MRGTVLTLSLLLTVGIVQDAIAASARIESAIGLVRVRMAKGKKTVKAVKGMQLPVGAVVATGRTGRAQIVFAKGELVRLGASTQFKVMQVRKGRRGATLLKLLVGNVRAMIKAKLGGEASFGIAAGTGVCAVKGTDFEVTKGKNTAPSFTVNSGSIMVGQSKGTGLGALQQTLNGLAGGTVGQALKEGFQVVVPAGKPIPKATPAPARTTLEVVTGTVKVVVQGEEKEVGPGEEIPPGATIVTTDEGAVLAGTKTAISVDPGTEFTYDAKVEGGTVNIIVEVEAGSEPVTIETGGTTAEVSSGSTVEVVQAPGEDVIFEATAGTVQVTTSDGTSQTLEAGETVTGTTEDSTTTDPTTTTDGTTDEGDTPPPPPDTTNQEVEVISPSAP